MQESIGIRSEKENLMCLPSAFGISIKSAKLVCPPSAMYARIAWDTKRKCKVDVPAKHHLAYTPKMRIRCARQAPYMQDSLWIRSENANLRCQNGEFSIDSLWKMNLRCQNANSTIDSHWKCEFAMPERRFQYRIPNGNTNLRCQT